MEIFIAEARKFFVRNKGWILVLVLLLAQLFRVCVQPRQYDFLSRMYHEQYENYLKVFGGKIDEEKIARLAEEEERLYALDGWSGRLFGQLYEGEISPEEYDRQWQKFADYYDELRAFMAIQNQYDRAKRNPEGCYVMDENGWFTAMQPTGPDLSLVIAAILAAVFIFCVEYESGMYGIICCTARGKTKTFLSKMMVLTGTIVLCGLIAAVTPLVFSGIRFGLSSGEYPIQSLALFFSCLYPISIIQGYFAIWGLKILGLCLTGFFLCSFVSC